MQAHERLETELARWITGTGQEAVPGQVVVCSSGTAALHLALEVLQLPRGAEVIVPDFTMVACARAVTLGGLTPVFVDCDDQLLMDQRLFSLVLGVPSALVLVHVYGRQAALTERTLDYLRRMRAYVVEDLAEAHGVPPHPRTDAACWSFYRNKIVAGEEGGAVYFKDPERARLARSLRSVGFTEEHDFIHLPRGHNYRMSDCHAELVSNSLARFNQEVCARRAMEGYHEELCPLEWVLPLRQAPWVYDLRIPGMDFPTMDLVVSKLREAGIPARHGFKPMSVQEEYQGCQLVTRGREPIFNIPQSHRAAREVFYLPLVWQREVFPSGRAQAETAFRIIREVVS